MTPLKIPSCTEVKHMAAPSFRRFAVLAESSPTSASSAHNSGNLPALVATVGNDDHSFNEKVFAKFFVERQKHVVNKQEAVAGMLGDASNFMRVKRRFKVWQMPAADAHRKRLRDGRRDSTSWRPRGYRAAIQVSSCRRKAASAPMESQ